MFNIVDLFCGTGAISYGLHSNDPRFRVIGGVDFEESACATAAANHPHGKFHCAAIENLPPQKFADLLPESRVDVVVGGPPCQGFSSLRPNRQSNVNDPRNMLYQQYVKYVQFFRPTVFLMENVVGILNADGGRLLPSIVRRFKRLGYATEWRVLNAANFGVPQKRERMVLIGVLRDRVSAPEIIFPEPTHHFSGRVIGTCLKYNYVMNTSRGEPAVTVMDAISDLPDLKSGESLARYRSKPKTNYQANRRIGASSRVSLHEAANHSEAMLRVIRHAGSSKSDLPVGMVGSGFSSCYSRMSPDEPATTITVKFTSPASSKCIHPFQDRAITPREAARLQGFDDGFVFCGSKTDIASQLGNAVPPLLGAAMAPSLIRNLEASSNAAEL